jgi:hypothetical protein
MLTINMVATINPGCIFEGPYGNLLPPVPAPDGTNKRKRWKREMIRGRVIEASGEKQWLVEFFGSGDRQLCFSTALKVFNDPRYTTIRNNNTVQIAEREQEPSSTAMAIIDDRTDHEPPTVTNVSEDPSSSNQLPPPAVEEEEFTFPEPDDDYYYLREEVIGDRAE